MYQKVMVPLDGSDLAECVLPHLEQLLAGSRNTSLVLIAVLENPVFMSGGEVGLSGDVLMKMIETHRSDLTEYLEKQQQRLAPLSGDIQTVILEADASTSGALVKYAESNNVELIVMATHGRSGISRWALGSMAERLLKSSCVPVLMVRAPGCTTGV